MCDERTINVSFQLKINVDADDSQIQEWLEFELRANGRMDGNNPLSSQALEAESFSVVFEDY